MSFDLGVWYSDRTLTAKEAGEIYVKLCKRISPFRGDSAAVLSFYNELIQKWPEIDTVPDEKIDDHDYCPWSCAIDRSGMHVILSCVWSKAGDVAKFVEQLAGKHGLLLYNPQENVAKLPRTLNR
jgi:hypothetical protein